MSLKIENNLTSEFIKSAGITICQPTSGYRYGSEAIRLASLCRASPKSYVVDLCAGCGIIGLIIAARDKSKMVTLVEIQHELSNVAMENIKLNSITNAEVINCDYRTLAAEKRGSYDIAVANPPFVPHGHGRLPTDTQRRIARSEVFGTLAELLSTTAMLLKNGGVLWLVIPKIRRDDCLAVSSKIFDIVYEEADKKHLYTKLVKNGTVPHL